MCSMLALKPREASFGMHAERGLPESEQTGSEEQRFAADWLVTIASSHHSRLLALCFEMLSTVNGVGESMLGAGVVGGCGDIVGGHSGVESLVGSNISVNSSSRIMVTRAQFIMLLTSVPNLPLQLIEGWFDALTLQFAHIAPPPAEVRLDFRRLLASSALICFALNKNGRDHESGDLDQYLGNESPDFVGGRRWMIRLLFQLYSLKKVSETAAAAAVGEGAEVQETDIKEVKGQKSSLLFGRIQDEESMAYEGLVEVVDSVVSLPFLLAASAHKSPMLSAPDPALYPAQKPLEINPVVQRLWGGQNVNSMLSMSQFAEALSVLELPAGALWQSCLLGPQRAVPFVSVNDKSMLPTPSTSPTRGGSWVFHIKEKVEVHQLEVGLRNVLRKRVAQEGAKVLVEVFDCKEPRAFRAEAEASERTILEHDNNYRCGWPELRERPVMFSEGFRVVFSIMGGASAPHMMGYQLMGTSGPADSECENSECENTESGGVGIGGDGCGYAHLPSPVHPPSRKRSSLVGADAFDVESSPLRRKVNVTLDNSSNEIEEDKRQAGVVRKKNVSTRDGVQTAHRSDTGISKTGEEERPEDRFKAVYRGSRLLPQLEDKHVGAGGTLGSAVSRDASPQVGTPGGSPSWRSPASSPERTVLGIGGSRAGTPPGAGIQMLLKRRGPASRPTVTIGSPRVLSPSVSSPGSFGPRRIPWKLASHTVKLNRYQGTVERFESLWTGKIAALDSSDGAGRWSGPHTPRSFQPLSPTCLSPLPFDSPRLRGGDSPRLRSGDSPTNFGGGLPLPVQRNQSSQALHHQSVCSALSSAASNSSSGVVPFHVQTRPRLHGGHSERTVFEMQSTPNQLLEALRFFELPLPEKNKPAFSWGTQQKDRLHLLARYIDAVARDVRKLCLAEPRCVHVQAPCYILGDIHGNYQDLIAFEKALWRIGLALSPANFLFLGDYVDRGAHSLEVITYLLAQKALCPEKIVLLRGNHEIRAQNSHPGYSPCFKQSCEQTFGHDLGAQIWESINLAFDTFPVAAIVDNNIFCVHGGIPAPDLLIRNVGTGGKSGPNSGIAALTAEINKIPRDLPNPDPAEGGNKLAWDLLWNDPAPANCGNTEENGFGDNQARGTGHVFTAHALEKFLLHYGLSHLVRAHEVRKTGFQVQQHSQMVTIFSSSGYCGAKNEACCILACAGKIRFIRLEHSLLPQLGSLASKAAAASAMVAAVAAGVQIPQDPHHTLTTGMDLGGAASLASSNINAGPQRSMLNESEETADMAAAAALAEAAVDNSKLRSNGNSNDGNDPHHSAFGPASAAQAFLRLPDSTGMSPVDLNPNRRLQQRIQQRLQERLKVERIKNLSAAPVQGVTDKTKIERMFDEDDDDDESDEPKNTCQWKGKGKKSEGRKRGEEDTEGGKVRGRRTLAREDQADFKTSGSATRVVEYGSPRGGGGREGVGGRLESSPSSSERKGKRIHKEREGQTGLSAPDGVRDRSSSRERDRLSSGDRKGGFGAGEQDEGNGGRSMEKGKEEHEVLLNSACYIGKEDGKDISKEQEACRQW